MTLFVEMLKRALGSNWLMFMEDIGLWMPAGVTNTEHDDKPANEPDGNVHYMWCCAIMYCVFALISVDNLVSYLHWYLFGVALE